MLQTHTYELSWDEDGDYVCLVEWVNIEDGVTFGTECTRWLIPGTQLEDR